MSEAHDSSQVMQLRKLLIEAIRKDQGAEAAFVNDAYVIKLGPKLQEMLSTFATAGLEISYTPGTTTFGELFDQILKQIAV